MIRVADYIAEFFVQKGIKHVFMVTGGGAMHLNDAFGKHKNLECIFNHHEQACAIAAEGYYRASDKIAVVNVTTGPGGLNTLTGIMGQWTDSIPTIYISGQVKFETTIESCPELELRQLGDQEVNIIEIVKPLTKYAKMVTDPLDIKEILEEAYTKATTPRFGPVWVDVPMNIQGALVDEKSLVGYKSNNEEIITKIELVNLNTKILEKLLNSKRPVIVAGHGVKLAGAKEELKILSDILEIPLVTTFNGFDIIPSDDKRFIGRIGTVGTRAGNFALQNSDFILFLGTRNNIRQISYSWEFYTREAYKVIVDIDKSELLKPTIKPDIPVNADIKDFLNSLIDQILADNNDIRDWTEWLDWCRIRKEKYPIVLKEYLNKSVINPYVFVDELTRQMENDDICIAGNGTACVALFQAGTVKQNQRIFWNSGCASMGYDLPASIGASIGRNKKQVICIAGDGSIQMNIQELQTVAQNKLPLKIFILNNGGYISIKQTQSRFFGIPYVGCDENSGVSFPDVWGLGQAYRMKTFRIENYEQMSEIIRNILDLDEPILCEVVLDNCYEFSPKLSSRKLANGKMVSSPLEDMYPFLDRNEFLNNMLIKPVSNE